MDVEPELRRRVRMAAASRDQSVKEWLEGVLERGLRRTNEDLAWMEGDFSRLGEFEPYEWAEGELEDEAPVRYEPGSGLRVTKPGGERVRGYRGTLDAAQYRPVREGLLRMMFHDGENVPAQTGGPSV